MPDKQFYLFIISTIVQLQYIYAIGQLSQVFQLQGVDPLPGLVLSVPDSIACNIDQADGYAGIVIAPEAKRG